jgi:hypothetical protein
MAIIGAHMLLNTTEAVALRAMLRDVFGLKSVDAGGGWLIFALPPSELGVHPTGGPSGGSRHEITFMCDNLNATIDELREKGVRIDGEPQDQGFGTTIMMHLPGDVPVMLYQPHHPMAIEAKK